MDDCLCPRNTLYSRKIFNKGFFHSLPCFFGSVARGTNNEESDVDIAIILKDAKSQSVQDKLVDFTLNLDLKYDKVFSVINIDYEEFLKWENVLPFYKNVKKDGVVLWKAA